MLGRDLRAQALHGDIPQQQREVRTEDPFSRGCFFQA